MIHLHGCDPNAAIKDNLHSGIRAVRTSQIAQTIRNRLSFLINGGLEFRVILDSYWKERHLAFFSQSQQAPALRIVTNRNVVGTLKTGNKRHLAEYVVGLPLNDRSADNFYPNGICTLKAGLCSRIN